MQMRRLVFVLDVLPMSSHEPWSYSLHRTIRVAQTSIGTGEASGTLHSQSLLGSATSATQPISVLWGLSQASARQLPAIIDTPMARLDVGHRNQLVELYFPQASHQVILLSTDTEIERNYFQTLQPHIARAYHLNYDEAGRCTVASEGYFWDTTGVRASDEVTR